jgi:hypothetical protein
MADAATSLLNFAAQIANSLVRPSHRYSQVRCQRLEVKKIREFSLKMRGLWRCSERERPRIRQLFIQAGRNRSGIAGD